MFRRNRKKKKSGVSKHFETRRQAYNAFKMDYGIPKSEQPSEVIKPDTPKGQGHKLDNRNVRLYIFDAILNFLGIETRKKTHLREDKEAFYPQGGGKQSEHFNAGSADENLKDHYYFKKKKRK